MKLGDFDYNLPKNLIAQKPKKPRDYSRLLVLNRKTGAIEHKKFYELADYLRPGDVLVLNNSKVFPARLIGNKADTGGKLEVFLLKQMRGPIWQCLLGGHGRREGLAVNFSRGLNARVIKDGRDGAWLVEFNKQGPDFMKIVEKIGLTPLPPYIKPFGAAQGRRNDKKNYQTVYADEKKIGSVAAPTAGFHFTLRLINKLKKKGVQFEYVTLHVGLGTFAPIKIDDITRHKMHAELAEVKRDVAKRIIKAKKENRRIICVGTTSARVLESAFKIKNSEFKVPSLKFWTDIFIYPGYKFKIVDGLITNFHLPKSTLLLLVSAFAGQKNINNAYAEAIDKKYRFYSYGDATFIF